MAPGKTMLKVVSILYIVFGGFFAILAILALIASSVLANFPFFYGFFGAWAGAWIGGIIFVVLLLIAAVDITIGIIGVKQCGNPSASLFFIITGFILGALSLISVIGAFGWNVVSLAMPVLFIIGGFMNQNAKTPTS